VTPSQAVVTPLPYARLTKADRAALLPAVRRYGQFLGVPAVLAGR
jgi:hypothetical protein